MTKAQDARCKFESQSHRDRVLTFYEHHIGSDLLEEFQRLFGLGKVVSVEALRVAIGCQSNRIVST